MGGFYTWVAWRIASLLCRPRLFLFVAMLTSAVLSAILANDIVCLAFMPVLIFTAVESRLLGLVFSTRTGSGQ